MVKHSHLLTFLTAERHICGLHYFIALEKTRGKNLFLTFEGLSPSDAGGYLPGKGMGRCCGEPF